MKAKKKITVHKKVVDGLTVYAFNDSGAQWVLNSLDPDHSEMRFNSRKFTMKESMQVFADIYNLAMPT